MSNVIIYRASRDGQPGHSYTCLLCGLPGGLYADYMTARWCASAHLRIKHGETP